MKKMILITIIILSALFLVAAYAVSSPLRMIEGTLRWTRSSTCGLPDYISTDSLGQKNVYLTGSGFPSRGELSGCKIRAEGYYLTGLENCRVFSVQIADLSCPTSNQIDR
jgi:hypothetical protein